MARSLALAACSVVCLLWSCEAGSITFGAAVGPNQFVLQGQYRFYVAQGSIQKGLSTATLTDLKFEAAKPTTGVLELGIMPVREFDYVQKVKEGLCTGVEPFTWKKELQVVGVELTQEPKTLELKMPGHGGAYMLVFANCAVNATTTISGSVAIKNSWGFLDTIDFWKVPIYGCALVLMAFACLVYVFFIMQQDEEMRDVQYYGLLIGTLGLGEAAMQVFALYLENKDGKTRDWMREPAYLVKLLYFCACLTQMGQGLGFTQARLDFCSTAKSFTVALAFLVALMPKICFFSMRPHMASVDTGAETLLLAALIAVAFVSLCWLTMTLGRTLGELRKRDDTEALHAFRRIVMLLFTVILAAVLALAFQIGVSADAEAEWLHAVSNDGIASCTILVATCVLMYLSLQNYTSKTLQMSTLPTHEGDVGDDGVEIDNMDDEEANIFGESPPKAEQAEIPAAETIGATGAME